MNAQLFDSPETAEQQRARINANKPATEKQIRYLEALRASKDIDTMGPIPADLTVGKASEAIEWLKARPYAVKAEPVIVRPTEPGMYAATADTTRIFRVKQAKVSRKLYAVELIDGAWEFTSWTNVPELSRMTPEQARFYGRQTGRCVICQRELTDPQSVVAGIGPVCAGRL